MALNHLSIATAVNAVLVANTTPVFQAVLAGQPLGLPLGGPYAAYWYLGRGVPVEGTDTLGQVMLIERWQIAFWWPLQAERSTIQALEVEIADCDQSTRTAFWADADLGASVATYIDLTDSEVGFGRFPLAGSPANAKIYRGLGYELHVADLEGEAKAK